MKRIGMRNLKTAFAVFICIILASIFDFDSPFYACIAAVICMQSSVFDSFTVGKNRMKGTIIGAIIGFLFALINPGNAILSAIGVMLIIYICNIFKSTKSISIACVVFIAIMVNLEDQSPLAYSSFRLIETFMGIIVAVLVNYFIYPPKYLDALHETKETLINSIFLLFKSEVCYSNPMELSILNKQISDFDDLLKNYISEVTPKKDGVLKIEELKKVLKLSKKAYSHLFMLKSLDTHCGFNDFIKNKVKTICKLDIVAREYTNSDISIVYNYHIDKLIDILNSFEVDFDKY
jgi:uncharacterized membrane protein YgaE (UPF0421/DUF939 family)